VDLHCMQMHGNNLNKIIDILTIKMHLWNWQFHPDMSSIFLAHKFLSARGETWQFLMTEFWKPAQTSRSLKNHQNVQNRALVQCRTPGTDLSEVKILLMYLRPQRSREKSENHHNRLSLMRAFGWTQPFVKIPTFKKNYVSNLDFGPLRVLMTLDGPLITIYR